MRDAPKKCDFFIKLEKEVMGEFFNR